MEIGKVLERWTLSFGTELWDWLVVLLVRCSRSNWIRDVPSRSSIIGGSACMFW